MALNVIDLQTELTYEFFEELSKSKKMGWGSWRVFWYGARSSALSAVVANLPGVKLTLSVDEPKNLSKLIARASLFADHIAIRHQSLIPSGGGGLMGDVPLDFAGYQAPQWVKKNEKRLNELINLPHFRGVPHEIEPFLDWTLKQGRKWIESGLVTYAPFLPPEQVELVSSRLPEGININQTFRDANILPDAISPVNDKVARALWSIPFPYLDGIKPDDLVKVKEDNRESLQNFHASVLQALKHIDKYQGTDEFNKEVQRVYNEIVKAGLAEVDNSISKLKKMAFLRTSGVSVEFAIASLAFYFGVPPFLDAAGFGKAIWDLAEALSEHNKERASITEKPMFILTKLRQRRKK